LAANAEVRWKSDLVVLIMILLYYACLFPYWQIFQILQLW
jgi:hypothetical protein